MGNQFSLSFRKLNQTNSSCFASNEMVSPTGPEMDSLARVLFRLNLKQRRNGHICETWFKHPMRFCISFNVVVFFLVKSKTKSLYFFAFSTGKRHDKVSVLKKIPSTLPNFEQEKAFSKFLQSGARITPVSLQTFLYTEAKE